MRWPPASSIFAAGTAHPHGRTLRPMSYYRHCSGEMTRQNLSPQFPLHAQLLSGQTLLPHNPLIRTEMLCSIFLTKNISKLSGPPRDKGRGQRASEGSSRGMGEGQIMAENSRTPPGKVERDRGRGARGPDARRHTLLHTQPQEDMDDISRYAFVTANIPNENRGRRYNLRISHPSRSHPTHLPHPGTAITTNRAKPRIWPREGKQGKRKIGWSQAIYPLRARLQELKSHLLLEKGDEALGDEFMELKVGEQAFMATRPKLIQAGYTTLDSIPRLKKRSGTRFYCPALKGVDSTTQDKVSKWIRSTNTRPTSML